MPQSRGRGECAALGHGSLLCDSVAACLSFRRGARRMVESSVRPFTCDYGNSNASRSSQNESLISISA
jgi:hypothetical protein